MPRSRSRKLNTLWIARKKTGLGQKSVARLLGHKSASTVSEYETGRLLPNLVTALKLAAIYKTPVSELFKPIFGELEQEIETIRSKHPHAYKHNHSST